jgi:hypothetical protein
VGRKRKETPRKKADRERGRKRRRRNGIPQGLMHKFGKLQGPFCKVKFTINLKP